MKPFDEDRMDQERLLAAAEAYDANLRAGATVSIEFSKQHPDLVSVLELLNDVLAPETASSPIAAFDSDPVGSPPTRIGRFQIHSEVGRGGFAVVYRAFDELLQRDVAVKIITAKQGDNTVGVVGQLDEARASARLSHPNIVTLYEVHQEDDSVYLVSEFCEGPTLRDWLLSHPGAVAVDLAAEVVRQLADAVAHAHARGLIHRDIKPENVLLSPCKDRVTTLPFIPRLTDFGLARDVLATDGPTTPIGIAGTLDYIAPELILGRQSSPHPACDVYSLGVLFYLMLTGRPPHQGSNTLELMKNICTHPVPTPRLFRPTMSPDIDAICLKCLSRDPDRRYRSARELADDLERWQSGRSVLARTQSFLERTATVVRRHPIESVLLATVFFVAVTATAILTHLNRQLSNQEIQLRTALLESRQQRRIADANHKSAVSSAYQADLVRGFEAYGQHRIAEAQQITDLIERNASQTIPIGSDLRILKALTSQRTTPMKQHLGEVNAILVVPQHPLIASAGDESVVHFYDQLNGKLTAEHRIEGANKITSLASSSDGGLMAIGYSATPFQVEAFSDNAIAIVRLSDWQILQTLHGFPTTITSLDFSPDTDRIAIGCRYEDVIVRSLSNASSLVTIESDRRNDEVHFSHEGDEIISFCLPNIIRIYDTRTGRINQELKVAYQPHHIAVDPNDDWVAVSDFHSTDIHIYDSHDLRRCLAILTQAYGKPQSLAISETGDRLIAGLRNGGVVCWQTQLFNQHLAESELPITLTPIIQMMVLDEPISFVTFTTKDAITCGGENGSMTYCRLSAPVDAELLDNFATQSAILSPDGKSIYAGCDSGDLLVLHVDTGAIDRLDARTFFNIETASPLTQLKGSSAGNLLAMGWEDGSILLLSLPDREVVWRRSSHSLGEHHQHGIKSILFDANDQRVIVFRDFDQFQVWNCGPARSFTQPTSTLVSTQNDHYLERHLGAACLIPNTETLIYGGLSEDVRTVNLGGGAEQTFLPNCGRVTALLFDKHRQRVISGDSSGRIRVHGLDGALITSCENIPVPLAATVNDAEVTTLALTPDGNNLVSGSKDGELRIWDAIQLRYLGTIHAKDGRGPISNIDFSRDGRVMMYHQAVRQSSGRERVHLLRL